MLQDALGLLVRHRLCHDLFELPCRNRKKGPLGEHMEVVALVAAPGHRCQLRPGTYVVCRVEASELRPINLHLVNSSRPLNQLETTLLCCT